jgi:hypothetical protein
MKTNTSTSRENAFPVQMGYTPQRARKGSCHRSVNIVTAAWVGQQENWGLIPGGARDFSLYHHIQTN